MLFFRFGLFLRVILAFAFAIAATTRAAESLNLFAWSEYVPQKVIEGFTRETGIKVHYATYASGEQMLSKLLAGGAAYDLIQPPDYIAEALIKNKLLRPLDRAKLPNFRHLAPEFVALPHDPASAYTVPYMIGTVGIVVNTERVKEPIRGYRDLFQKKYANRIVVVNDNREIVSWALVTLGLSQNNITRETLAKVRPLIAEWLKLVKVFDSDSPKTPLLNGDVDLGVVWSGEAAKLINENKKFTYVLPAEGYHPFVDLLAIPATAKNPAAAHRFLDYVLRPEVSKLISDEFPYTNPNLAARKLLSPEQLGNPASYPVLGRLDTFRDIGKAAAEIDKLMTDLKTAAAK
ncbi:MAG: spermidine/putrescine ABC transporter substrate-binding protein [Opitutaceae bacterium]|nr:spermidine/putrescine ABC transporter substrate-binding protein [Opitutaceae bacterium]